MVRRMIDGMCCSVGGGGHSGFLPLPSPVVEGKADVTDGAGINTLLAWCRQYVHLRLADLEERILVNS